MLEGRSDQIMAVDSLIDVVVLELEEWVEAFICRVYSLNIVHCLFYIFNI